VTPMRALSATNSGRVSSGAAAARRPAHRRVLDARGLRRPIAARDAASAVWRYFETNADAVDRLYDAAGGLRHGPQLTRDLAVAVVERHRSPDVLDVGCGPGRVGEAVLDAGAASYVGIDFSPRMLELARCRLAGREHVELVERGFLDIDLGRTFTVVLAVGLFEYLDEPARAAAWMRAHCSSALVTSFTRWDWLKGPVRHAHYRLHGCRLRDYTEETAEALLRGAGFSRVTFPRRGRRGFHVVAR